MDGEVDRLYRSGAEHSCEEGWPSGLRRTPGKRVGVNAPPGFESPSLRHYFLLSLTTDFVILLEIT
jgi:hypothetical protein